MEKERNEINEIKIVGDDELLWEKLRPKLVTVIH